jgi:hypothetical protein
VKVRLSYHGPLCLSEVLPPDRAKEATDVVQDGLDCKDLLNAQRVNVTRDMDEIIVVERGAAFKSAITVLVRCIN